MAKTPFSELESFAREARKAIEDPAYQRAVGELYQTALNTICTSEPQDQEAREGAYWLLRALDRIAQHLKMQTQQPDFESRRRGQIPEER